MPRHLDFVPTNRLREIRKATGKSLMTVADGCGTNAAQIQKLETGERELSLYWLTTLGSYYSIPPADLLLLPDGGLTDRERAIIDRLRAMPDYNRRMIEAAIFTEPSPPPA